MLILLKSRKRLKKKELAKYLEVSEKQIMRYRENIEMARIRIDIISGPAGGYELRDRECLFGISFTEEEEEAIILARHCLGSDNFKSYDNFSSAIDKLSCLCVHNKGKQSSNISYLVKEEGVNYDTKREDKLWLDFKSCVIIRQKVEIKYLSSNDEITKRVIRPYGMFQYRTALYVVGYCEKRKALRQFKLIRIQEYKYCNEHFDKDESFDLDEYIDAGPGIFRDQKIKVEIKIHKPFAQNIKERALAKNQEIIEVKEEGFIILKGEMSGKADIKRLVLGMGRYAELLKPEYLREEMLDEINILQKYYEKSRKK
jgi:predicted DNA-binding transcriptional regulator YafY